MENQIDTSGWKWDNNTELEYHDLQAFVAGNRKKDEKKKKVLCSRVGCYNLASDVHHIDGDHSNNAPENTAESCKLCHNAVHGISPRMSDLRVAVKDFYDVQELRKATDNRVRAYKDLGIALPQAEAIAKDVRRLEDALSVRVERMARQEQIYAGWLEGVRGVGPFLAGVVVSIIQTPERFSSVGKLQKYAALDVEDGKAPRRETGEKFNRNGELRMTLWKIAGQFVKDRKSFGRVVYDRRKAEEVAKNETRPDRPKGARPSKKNPKATKAYYEAVARGEKLIPGHVNNRALRRVMKDFLRCLWVTRRETENLPVPEPQPGTWPMPDDWLTVQS